MADSGWEHFEHEADVGLRGWGPTRAEAYANAARALTAVITDPETVRPAEAVAVAVTAPDPELLLVEWLDALIYEMATRGMLFTRYEVALTANGLTGTAWGEPMDGDRHQPAVEVKGTTLTALRVVQRADGSWLAECVVDV